MSECSASIEMAAKLCGVERKDLEGALCNQTRKVMKETVKSPVNVRTASDNRDALAKALYGMIFQFIVKKTNVSIGYLDHVKLFVGVLDIFGFECFKMNSFEQLCINFTNERLQQFFNQFVFKLEEQLYEREGIPWDPLDFPDNQDAVDILQAKTTGVFARSRQSQPGLSLSTLPVLCPTALTPSWTRTRISSATISFCAWVRAASLLSSTCSRVT